MISDRGTNSPAGQLVWFQRQPDGTYIKWTVEAGIGFHQAAVGDYNKDGTLDIAAVGFDLETVNLYLNDGSFNFTKTTLADSARQRTLIEANDMDGDGDLDLVVGGEFRLLYNDGAAVFDSSKTLYTWSDLHASSARGIAISDLNNDGKKDILTFSGVGMGGLYFLNGADNFDQTLLDREGIDLGGDILVADLDSNGFLDIVRQQYYTGTLSILYQDSTLSFRKEFIEINWDNRISAVGSQMSIGDLDGDGDTDLVVPEHGSIDGDLAWFENIDGRLYRHYLYSEIQAARIPKIADMDADGDLDIVFSAGDDSPARSRRENEIVWYENRGDSGFVDWRIEDNVRFPADIELADIDGDGNLDVVATARDNNALYWYKRSGPNWQRFTIEDNANMPLGSVVADLDSDGDKDVVLCSTGENKIFWYMNDGSGAFSRRIVDANLRSPQEIEAGDFNNDGHIDLAVAAADTGNSVALYINDGQQVFARTLLSIGQLAYDIEIGDWNSDGFPDIVACFDRGSTGRDPKRDVALFSNDGDANFTDSDLIVQREYTRILKLVDADGDNDLDLAFGGPTIRSKFQLALNQAGEIDSLLVLSNQDLEIQGIDAADLDGDGIIDFVTSDQRGGNVLFFKGLGFTTAVSSSSFPHTPRAFALSQNYPNPFNPATTIKFSLAQAGSVKLSIFNILGQEVAVLVDENYPVGVHTVSWDGSQQPSGVYFYRLELDTQTPGGKKLVKTRKLALLK